MPPLVRTSIRTCEEHEDEHDRQDETDEILSAVQLEGVG